MENYNTIKFEDNKITITTSEERQIFEPLRNPLYEIGTQFLNYKKVKYFLTKIKPIKVS
jgi:hypothetical protein